MATSDELARLLEHPVIWRGSRAAQKDGVPTGFPALDACLPGGGWPRAGLIEVLHERTGCGEISLVLPTLAGLCARPGARWCAWVAPAVLPGEEGGGTLEPYAPALAAAGLDLARVLVVRPGAHLRGAPLWAFEQALRSGACEAALAWLAPSSRGPRMTDLRRLQLAAEHGRSLGILFRDSRAAREPSAASLRVLLTRTGQGGTRLTVLKSRGGFRGSIDLPLPGDHGAAAAS